MNCVFTKTSLKHCLQVQTPSMTTLFESIWCFEIAFALWGKAIRIKHEMYILHLKWPILTLNVIGVLSSLLSFTIQNYDSIRNSIRKLSSCQFIHTFHEANKVNFLNAISVYWTQALSRRGIMIHTIIVYQATCDPMNKIKL